MKNLPGYLPGYLPGSLLKSHLACAAHAVRVRFAGAAILALAALPGAVPAWAQTGTPAAIITTLAGNGTAGFSGDGLAAAIAELNSPSAVAVDTVGNMFIADTYNYVIRKVATDGRITTVAGTPGIAGTTGDGGLASSAKLILPRAIAVDYHGDLYFVDGDSIRKVEAATGIITKLKLLAPPGAVCGGCATYALNAGVALARDTASTLFVADAGHNQVLKMDLITGYVGLLAGNGSAGYSGEGGDARDAELNAPEGVAYDAAHLRFVIADTGNCMIRVVYPNGAIAPIAGTATCGHSLDQGNPSKVQLNQPRSVVVDSLGVTYIADTGNQVIRAVSSDDQRATIIAGSPGIAGFAGDGGTATSSALNTPSGLAIDSAANLYITDIGNQRIREITDATSTPSPTFSPAPDTYNSTQSVSIVDSAAGATIYYTIDGSTPTTSSTIYSGSISVSSTETIRAIALANGVQSAVVTGVYTIGGQIITTVAGNGTAGYGGDGSAATAAQLSRPWGTVEDASGNLYIADFVNSVVRKVSHDGTITTVVGDGYAGYLGDGGPGSSARLNNPAGLALDASGDLYIADFGNSVVRKLTPDGIIQTVAGNGTQGYWGDGGTATSAQMMEPIAVATDLMGSLFIADVSGERIRKVAPDGTISTVAGDGTKGYSGDSGPATSAQLQDPEGVAVDAFGNLYIGDMNNQAVRKVTPGGIISTVAGTAGSYGYSGEGGPATSAKISSPAGVAVDAAGNLFIADPIDLIALKVNSFGTISTVVGNGTQGYSGDGGPPTDAQLNYFYGISVDAFGTLYIPDTQNNVIRRVGLASVPPVTAPPTFDLAPGTYSSDQTVNITDSTTGATIYYTIDGTVPTAASAVYSGPITISATETVKAIAGASGYFQSAVAAASYTISIPLPPMIIWPNPVPIAFGTPLDGTQLNASSGAVGSYAYTPGSGTVLGVGYHTLSVTFTPADPTQYTTLTRTVSLHVTQGAPVPSPIITTVAGIKGSYGYSGDGGPAIQAQLNQILQTAVDTSGNLYIGDRGNYRIRKVAPDGTIITVAGKGVWGYSGDEGAATDATMQDPGGIALDSAGNLYIVDTYNLVVRKVTPDGIIHAFAGNHTSGNSGDGGKATDAQFTLPLGIAVDSADNVYISDAFASVVRKVTPAGIISTVAGTGNYLYWGDGGKAIDAGIKAPEGLAVDSSGNLYIAEFIDNVIRKVDINGNISTFAGTNANGAGTNIAGIGVAGYYGDGGPATSALLNNCRDLATDATGNLYISDGGNSVVRMVAVDGIITTIAGNGVSGYSGDGGPATSAEITYPGGIALDPSGSLYIADIYNNVVREVGPGARPIAPPPSFSPAGGSYDSAQLVSIVTSVPVGATIYFTTDGTTPTTSSAVFSGTISIASTETIQAIVVAPGYTQSPVATATYNIVSTPVITWPNPAPAVDGTVLSATQLNANASVPGTFVYAPAAGTVLAPGSQILSVTFTPTDSVHYGPATATVTILVFSNDTPIITTVAGDGTAAYSGDGTQATSAQLSAPLGVAVDASGAYYIADSDHGVVRKVTPDGIISTVAGNGTFGYSGDGGNATSAQLYYPRAVVVDASGNLYISDYFNCVIRKVTPDGIISTIAGNGTVGNAGDGGVATKAQLNHPAGLAIDNAGNLLIADVSNGLVRKVTPGGTITTVAGNSTGSNLGDGGPATSTLLGAPLGLAVDSNNNIFISDNNTIRKVNSSGIITTVAGHPGHIGYSGDGGAAVGAVMDGPSGIAVDHSGAVYVADSNNSVIRRIVDGGNITTVAGTGASGFSGDGGPATLGQLSFPSAVAFDTSGNMFISDTSNNRIRRIGSSKITATATPVFNPGAGTYTTVQNVTITDSIPGASIYYTTDGTVPTPTSTVYTGPITVSSTETVQAIAVAFGQTQSAVAAASYILNIAKTTQSITFNSPPSLTYGQTPLPLIATASSGLPVTYYVMSGPATVSGPTLTITGTGNVQLMAVQNGDETYSAAQPVTQFFNVGKAELVVTASDASRTYGAANPAFTYTITGFQNGETSSVVSGVASMSTPADATSLPGTYPIVISASSLISANYYFTLVGGTLTVTPAPDFKLTATPSQLIIRRGQSGTIALQLTPVGKYLGSVTLKCGSLPVGVTCTFTPASLTVDGTDSVVQGTLTINTAIVVAQTGYEHRGNKTSVITFAGCLLPGELAALFFAFRFRRRDISIRWSVLPVILLCGLAGLATSCGGSSRMAQPGTSTIVVTAMSGTGDASHQLNLEIIIQ